VGPDQTSSLGPLQTSELTTAGILHEIATAKPVDAPLPSLASPIFNTGTLSGPYGLVLGDPAFSVVGDDEDEAAQQWGLETRWEIDPSQNPLKFDIVFCQPDGTGSVAVELTASSTSPDSAPLALKFNARSGTSIELGAISVLKKQGLSIRYESGHTISDGFIYEMKFRDQPFEEWDWVDLAGYDVSQEKPLSGKTVLFERIGESTDDQRSLFSWVAENFTDGWLACDDGAGEVADFIHIDDMKIPPVVTLIHVKGSGSSAVGREISATDYEVVCGQTVKNVRYLDGKNLAQELAKPVGKGAKGEKFKATWHDGLRQPNRQGLIAAANALSSNHKRRVVVLQPRVTQSELTKSRTSATPAKQNRLHQLDALLLATQASLRSLGVELTVYGDSNPQLFTKAPRKATKAAGRKTASTTSR
jgi:hypothetical protein